MVEQSESYTMTLPLVVLKMQLNMQVLSMNTLKIQEIALNTTNQIID